MGRANKKAVKRGPLQRLYDREHTIVPGANDPDNFARQHGDYERIHGIGTGGELNMRPHINRGGTPIARWRRDGHISETQDAAIAHCIQLWEIISSSGKLVANLDRTVFGCPGDGHPMEVEARSDLHRIKAYIPEGYFSVFENVVRFDEPAGRAGSKFANEAREAQTCARTIVQFVADIIAMKERLSY